MIDPICIFHGKKRSEHICLVCCLCFKDMLPEDCHRLSDGKLEDVCKECAEKDGRA